jgi:hypothetical protein
MVYALGDSHRNLDSLLTMTLWQEFISLEVTSTSLVPTLKALLRSQEDLEVIRRLTGTEAQNVVDSVNQVRNHSLIVKMLTDFAACPHRQSTPRS